MPRNYSRTRAWGCAANAGSWLPAQTDVMSWCPVNGTGSSRRRKLLNVAVPEIKEDHCTGCCFYNEGSCLIRDPDHVDFPDCHDSGMIWMQKEINISDIKEKAIKLAIDAMKPIPICSSPCYSISDNRSPEEKHEEEMRFCKDLNDLRCEMLIDMAKKIEEYLL